MKEVSVIETNKWLEKNFDEPIEICQKIIRGEKAKATDFYRYLVKFGMYKPNNQSRETYKQLINNNVWQTVGAIYQKYRKEWKGLEIPIYIFPMFQPSELFIRSTTKKSGLSFQDKLFLFLTPDLKEKEIEALFVHEYHHVCRMNYSMKEIRDYTLLDSIVLEGLAELAVEECCGSDFLADWCVMYSNKQIEQFAKKFLVDNLSLKKDDRLHNQLLFGGGIFPKMLGYAAGYAIVSKSRDSKRLSLCDTFTISSETFTPHI